MYVTEWQIFNGQPVGINLSFSSAPLTTPIILILLNAGPLNISFADRDPRVSVNIVKHFQSAINGGVKCSIN